MARLSIDDVEEIRRAAAAATNSADSLDAARDGALKSARDADEEARRLVSELGRRAASARAALAACDAGDPARNHLTARLAAAEERLRRGETLARAIQRQVQDLHAYALTQAQRQRRLVERLTGLHNALAEDINNLHGILTQGHASSTTMRAKSTEHGGSAGNPPTNLATASSGGMSVVPLSKVEAAIEHVRGPEDFKKMSMADMRVALNLLEGRVQQAVASGAAREDLEALDRARGLTGASVNHAGVYDLFYGSDKIRLDRNSDGTYSITNGGHRIWLARQMGITELPADLRGGPT
jgi:hypothetical protein